MRERGPTSAPTPTGWWLGILALVLCATLVATLVTVLRSQQGDTLAEGEALPFRSDLYNGQSHELKIPDDHHLEGGRDLTLTIGEPVAEVERSSDDESDRPVHAEPGTRLIPISVGGWSFGTATEETSIRLLVDDREITLTDSTTASAEASQGPAPSSLVALDEDVELEDLTVEVTAGGTTQVLDAGTGRIDAGEAQYLYDELPSYRIACSEGSHPCRLRIADPEAPWRFVDPPSIRVELTVDGHHQDLGWADDGRLWATVTVPGESASRARNVQARNVNGERREVVDVRTEVLLDGRRPVETTDIDGGPTFSFDPSAAPRTVTVRRAFTLAGSESPRTLRTEATFTLTERGREN